MERHRERQVCCKFHIMFDVELDSYIFFLLRPGMHPPSLPAHSHTESGIRHPTSESYLVTHRPLLQNLTFVAHTYKLHPTTHHTIELDLAFSTTHHTIQKPCPTHSQGMTTVLVPSRA